MKTYKKPVMEPCFIAREDVLQMSILENIGTVIDFSKGEKVDPGYEEQ